MTNIDLVTQIWTFKHVHTSSIISKTRPVVPNGWELVKVVRYDPNATGGH